MGESGSGKSAIMESTGLATPLVKDDPTESSGPRCCDWWLLEKLIMIEIGGHHIAVDSEEENNDDWRHVVVQLQKYRKKRLNGVLLTVSADTLLSATPERLSENCSKIRRRLDELIDVSAVRFPVYLIVTKCDLIKGMVQFCNRLEDKQLNQAMGMINVYPSDPVDDVLGNTLDTIGQRLNKLRLLLSGTDVSEPDRLDIEPGVILFPEEFERLRPGLTTFVRGVFKETLFQEQPLLRGIFFSSAYQTGVPHSHFFSSFGIMDEKEKLPDTSKAIFLNDLFEKVLPNDNQVCQPNRHVQKNMQVLKRIKMGVWITIVVILGCIMSVSFMRHMRALSNISDSLSRPRIISGNAAEDVSTLYQLQQTIENMNTSSGRNTVLGFGFDKRMVLQVRLKQMFCKRFKDVLDSLTVQIFEQIKHFSHKTQSQKIAVYIPYLVNRFHLNTARIEGELGNELPEGWHLSTMPSFLFRDFDTVPDIEKKIAQLYVRYLKWETNIEHLRQENILLQKGLEQFFNNEKISLNWIFSWFNLNSDLTPLRVGDFWEGSLMLTDDVAILPIFSAEGKKRADIFLQKIETALPNSMIIYERKKSFYDHYRNSYIHAWQVFVKRFPDGKKKLINKAEWRRTADKICRGQGPYSALFEKMKNELTPWYRHEESFEWLNHLLKLNEIRNSTVNETAEKKIVARLYSNYKDTLSVIRKAIMSRTTAYDLTTRAFTNGQTPFLAADNTLKNIQSRLNIPTHESNIVHSILYAPLYFLWEYVNAETACYLQENWEKIVLAKLPNRSITERKNVSLSECERIGRMFIKDWATPFIDKDKAGTYRPKTVLGTEIDFNREFFKYFNPDETSRYERGTIPEEIAYCWD